MTPKERAAMQQALAALETDEQWGFVNKKVLERRIPAIAALRDALDHSGESNEMIPDSAVKESLTAQDHFRDATKMVAEQACPNGCDTSNGRCVDCPDYVAEQAEQEPLGDKARDNMLLRMIQHHFPSLPVSDEYTDWGRWLRFANAAFEAGRKDAANAKQEPVATDLMDMLRLIETIKYLRGIAERGLGREIREDETIEQFVLGYVKQLESTQPVKQEPVAWVQQVLDATSCDVKVVTPFRDYESMSPLDCYEAGVLDAGAMVRKSIQDKVKSVLNFYSEPVAWGHPNTAITGKKHALMMVELEIPSNAQYPQMWVPLYAAPVRTKDLTDDEIRDALDGCEYDEDTPFEITEARAVIAADREKNK